MASSITTPLEVQFGQISGLSQMTSISSFGNAGITLQFVLDRDIDAAAQDVQAAMNAAGGYLPKTPTPPTYSKVNPADAPILSLEITSDTLPLEKVNDLVDTVLAQKLSEVTGVGLVSIEGNQKPAVRVRVDPAAIANLGLGMEDIHTALTLNNINQPKGSFDGAHQSYAIGANDQIFTAADYKNVIVAYKNGSPVRLGDIGEVIDNVENTRLGSWVGGLPAVVLDIQRQPGANIIQTADRVKALLPRLRASIPPSVKVAILTDRTTTIRASIHDVQFTLFLTVALVVMVIFVFLRKFWATVIPSVALPLAIIGTFGIMKLIGFSLDNLSLMALTIATGFVVDDAIVMIENIVRYIEAGEKPLDAALKGSKQIGFTVISLSFSLIAVFIPLLFMTGIVGRLFREFAITLSVAVVVSAIVSLTLTPMMCARLLQPESESEHGRFYLATERMFQGMLGAYESGLKWVMKHQPLVLGVAIATLVATDLALHHHSQGPAPAAGHRLDHRRHRLRAVHLLQRDGRPPAPHRRHRRARTPMSSASPPSSARARSTPPSIPANFTSTSSRGTSARPAPAKSLTGCATPRKTSRAFPCTCRRCRTCRLTAASAAPNTSTPWRTRTRTSWRNGRPSCCKNSAPCPSWPTPPATSNPAACRSTWTLTASQASRLNVLPQAIDDTLYDAFGQRQVSIIFTQLNQYRVMLEASPRYQLDPGRPGQDLRQILHRPDGAAQRLCHDKNRDRPAQPSTMKGSFPPSPSPSTSARAVPSARPWTPFNSPRRKSACRTR